MLTSAFFGISGAGRSGHRYVGLVALVTLVGRWWAPAADGQPYVKG